ncbi:MAG: MBG domain-containing protein, partial [Caulobacteraceae bacterium]
MAATAPALPSGGVVTAGQAAIASADAGALSINQTSAKAIINWNSFSIGQGGQVQFNNGSGATLNRVAGAAPSSLNGLLSATGSVYLINPSGVIIGKTGVVKVGGDFVASTLDVQDSSFLQGGALTFTGASTAAAINFGKIGALGGDVALIAATVVNQGTMTAPDGVVGLLAGSQVLMRDQDSEDGRFAVLVGGPATSATNGGAILAAAAELKAADGNVYALAGNLGGLIKATQIDGSGGRIFLTASGGDVTVPKGAVLDASASGAGDGGHVLVDSAATTFQGTALARGGAAGGDGGLVETSGTTLSFAGAVVDTSAAKGKTGEWLLDPYDLTVDATAATTIQNSLAGSNVVLQTTSSGASGPGVQNASGVGDIIIAAPIAWSSVNSLTLDAYHSVLVNANLSISGAGGLVIKTNDGGTGGVYQYAAGASTSFGASGGALTVNGVGYTLVRTAADLANMANGLSGAYALANDVDLISVANWAPIGTTATPFLGALEGDGHAVSNLTISDTSTAVSVPVTLGLFGVTNSATITNLTLTNPMISASSAFVGDNLLVGALVGQAAAAATSTVPTILNNVATVGGAITITTQSSGSVGGLIGSFSSSLNKTATSQAGVLTNGVSSTSVNVDQTVASSSSNYTVYVGGLLGALSYNTVSQSSSTGAVTVTNALAGGLVGRNVGQVTNCYATGAVTGSGGQYDILGGLVGVDYSTASSLYTPTNNTTTGNLTNVYAQGNVTENGASGAYIGGLIGEIQTANNASATPTARGAVTNAYASGAVSATGSTVGGDVGGEVYISGTTPLTLTNVYFDMQAAGLSTAFGGTVGTPSTAQGLTTAALQAGPTGLTTSPWVVSPGHYPFLSFYSIAGTVYSEYGQTPLGGVNVVESVLTTGVVETQTTSASGGAYSIAAPAANGTVILFLANAGQVADTIVNFSGASQTGINLYGGYLNLVNTSASTLSGALANLSGFVAPAGYASSDFLFTASGGTATPTASFALSAPGAFSIDQALNLGSNGLVLSDGGAVTQTAAITAGNALLLGTGGAYTLTNAGNSIGTLAANTGTAVLVDSTALTVGVLGGVSGATLTGNLTLSTTGALTVSAPILASGAQGALLTSATFVNTVGANAVSTPDGRWVIDSNAPAGDTFDGLNSGATAIWAATSAGAVSATGDRYAFAYQPTLTFTATSESKTYGVDDTSSLPYTVTGLQPGVSNAYLADTAATAYSGAPALTSGGAAAGASVGGYSIVTARNTVTPLDGYAAVFANGTLTVTPAALTITANNQSKVYGAAVPTLTDSYSGFVAGDTSASLTTQPTTATTATASSHVAGNPYAISVSGAADSNYTISYVAGGLTITPAALTITANNQTKVYGAAVPTLTDSYSGFVNGDTASSLSTQPTLTTTATQSSHVSGSPYAITASSAADSDYAISYVAGALTVTPAALTITADNQTKIYGAAIPTLTDSYSGFVNGDTTASLSTAPTNTTTATAASHVAGSPYAITASGAADSDYTISYVAGALTITPAALTITADNQSKVYGAAVPVLTDSYTGFVNGDTAAGLTTQPNTTTTATASSHVAGNPYAISVSGAADSDYAISYVAGGLTVTPAALTITANNQTKVYGAAVPTLTDSYSGFVNGDTAASLSTQPTLTTTATAASHVAGNPYAITASGAADSDYAISYVAGALTVTPAALTITADNQTKVYGAAIPALTDTYSGFVNGDTSASLSTAPTNTTTATAASHVAGSPYAINVSGAADSDYTISYIPGSLTVTPAALTITADNQTKVYGAAVPTLTDTYSGLVNGDTPSSLSTAPTNTTTATAASHVAGNPYAITVSGAADSDYAISYVAGALTVTPAALR